MKHEQEADDHWKAQDDARDDGEESQGEENRVPSSRDAEHGGDAGLEERRGGDYDGIAIVVDGTAAAAAAAGAGSAVKV